MEISTQVTYPSGETIERSLLIMDEEIPKKGTLQPEHLAGDEKEKSVGELGINEGRRTLDHQVESLRQQKDHFIEIMKLNLICLSILVAAFEIGGINFDDLSTVWLALPLVSFLLSIMLSVSMYHSINPAIGMNSRSIYELGPDEDLNENIQSLKRTYASAINRNMSKINKSSRIMSFSYLLTLGGISSAIGVVSRGFL